MLSPAILLWMLHVLLQFLLLGPNCFTIDHSYYTASWTCINFRFQHGGWSWSVWQIKLFWCRIFCSGPTLVWNPRKRQPKAHKTFPGGDKFKPEKTIEPWPRSNHHKALCTLLCHQLELAFHHWMLCFTTTSLVTWCLHLAVIQLFWFPPLFPISLFFLVRSIWTTSLSCPFEIQLMHDCS